MRRQRWQLLVIAAALAGAVPAGHRARAADAPIGTPDPRPVPVLSPGGPIPVSTVNHFNGLVGIVDVRGTGTDNRGNALDWVADLRFMQGSYLGRDGVARSGTFCFI